MIETRYYLERKSLTHRIVYIEPEREYGYEIEHAGMGLGKVRHLIYNDIDPNTGNRTGGYYRASDLFRTEQECKDALIDQIKDNIKKKRREIYRLEKRCKELEHKKKKTSKPLLALCHTYSRRWRRLTGSPQFSGTLHCRFIYYLCKNSKMYGY
jgi:hypothetical protein